MNNIDITPVVNSVITLVIAVIGAFLIPYIKKQTKKLDETEDKASREDLAAWAKIGVAAAEQIFQGSGRGEEKKAYVLKLLEDKGFCIDLESVNATIEAAVQQLNKEGIIID